ncbi:MAG: hypothetical protein J5850_06615 [Clostridia bacterium]|nr:hypothetical protein [Clostridia bacterium]
MISEGYYDDYLDCFCVRYVLPDEWESFEADEFGSYLRHAFGVILESMTPVFHSLGLLDKISEVRL